MTQIELLMHTQNLADPDFATLVIRISSSHELSSSISHFSFKVSVFVNFDRDMFPMTFPRTPPGTISIRGFSSDPY